MPNTTEVEEMIDTYFMGVKVLFLLGIVLATKILLDA